MNKHFLRVSKVTAWILITALAVVTLVSIFWTPFDRSKLFRPLPAGAVLIGSLHDPDLRLEHVVTNAFLAPFVDPENSTIAELSKGRFFARRVISAPAVFAYAPGPGGSSAPSIAFASSLGGWTVVFRWALWIHPPKEIMPAGENHGRRLWAYRKPVMLAGAPNFLSFAFEEGLVIGCLSREREGIARLLMNYDGQGDSIVNTPQWKSMEKSSEADKVWLKFPWPSSGSRRTILADCTFDQCNTNGLAVSVSFEPDIIPSKCVAPGRNPPEIGKMFVPLPAILGLFPSEAVEGLVNGLAAPAWAGKVNAILVPGENKMCLLMVLTGAHGGRYGVGPFQIAVPAILLAVSGCKAEQAGKDISGLLDLINARYRAGLVINSQVAPAGRRQVSAIESVYAGSLIGSMPEEDRPAFCFYNDWLLLSSNGASLRKVIADLESEAGAKAGGLWVNNPDLGKLGSFVVCDPESGGRVLRLALMGAILMLERERGRSNESMARMLRAGRSWLEKMDRLENCRLWFEPEGSGSAARIEIGKK